jgi:transcriptional regulator of acetoin/glycerol metabolism
LERLNGDKMATARLLGIGKTTLYRKLREYGIADRWVARAANNNSA